MDERYYSEIFLCTLIFEEVSEVAVGFHNNTIKNTFISISSRVGLAFDKRHSICMKKCHVAAWSRFLKRALCDDPYCYIKCLTDSMVNSYEVHVKNWYVWHVLDKKKKKRKKLQEIK